jgi:hypothetical protein
MKPGWTTLVWGLFFYYPKRLKMFPKQVAELEKAVLQELEGIALEKMQCLREDINIYEFD